MCNLSDHINENHNSQEEDLELELNMSFDQLLQDIESGKIVLPTSEPFKVTATSTTPAGKVNT